MWSWFFNIWTVQNGCQLILSCRMKYHMCHAWKCINKYVWKIFKILWPNGMSNTEMWTHAQEKPVPVQTILQKQKWTEHTLTKDSSAVQKQASSWNHQEQHRSVRLRRTWRIMKEEEAQTVEKTWREVKATAVNRVCWHSFMDTVYSEVE